MINSRPGQALCTSAPQPPLAASAPGPQECHAGAQGRHRPGRRRDSPSAGARPPPDSEVPRHPRRGAHGCSLRASLIHAGCGLVPPVRPGSGARGLPAPAPGEIVAQQLEQDRVAAHPADLLFQRRQGQFGLACPEVDSSQPGHGRAAGIHLQHDLESLEGLLEPAGEDEPPAQRPLGGVADRIEALGLEQPGQGFVDSPRAGEQDAVPEVGDGIEGRQRECARGARRGTSRIVLEHQRDHAPVEMRLGQVGIQFEGPVHREQGTWHRLGGREITELLEAAHGPGFARAGVGRGISRIELDRLLEIFEADAR